MIDCLAFSPHPDDVELFCSGTLLKMKNEGLKTGIIDLSRGELSSNGSIETRKKESEQASLILGLDIRENCGFPDGDILNSNENRLEIIKIIRKYRPKTVLLPYWIDRHPDHENASNLLQHALFHSGLKKIDTGQQAYRPANSIYYMLHTPFIPSFIVDISDEFEKKKEAIEAFRSQFQISEKNDSQTYINDPAFLESIVIRAKYFGSLVGVNYGEPFFLKNTLKIDNINTLFS